MAQTCVALPWWGYAAAKALSEGGSKWRIRKMYIEFENVDADEDPVSVPSVDPMNPQHALPYYAGLADAPARDYLRVDLVSSPLISNAEDYENYFEDGEGGNLLQLFAQSAGTVGTHGKAFSSAARSKVCGTALVVAPVENDPTQDIVVARGYYDEDEQILKVPGMQIGVTADLPFVLPE